MHGRQKSDSGIAVLSGKLSL